MDQVILEKEALRLPPHQRALLADTLLGSLDDEADATIEVAWADEAESRLTAFHEGTISSIDGPQSIRELRSQYSK